MIHYLTAFMLERYHRDDNWHLSGPDASGWPIDCLSITRPKPSHKPSSYGQSIGLMFFRSLKHVSVELRDFREAHRCFTCCGALICHCYGCSSEGILENSTRILPIKVDFDETLGFFS